MSLSVAPPTHHVFVDFENVHDVDLAIVGKKTVRLTLLVGAGQHKLPTELVERLLRHTDTAALIRLKSPGKNALDFALAYHVGTAAARDPKGRFHIISKDTGFDPLVEHLREHKIRVRRHADFSTLAIEAPAQPPKLAGQTDSLYDRAISHLRANAKSRPKNRKTLVRCLKSLTGGTATDFTIESLIQRLASANHLSIGAKDAVVYAL